MSQCFLECCIQIQFIYSRCHLYESLVNRIITLIIQILKNKTKIMRLRFYNEISYDLEYYYALYCKNIIHLNDLYRIRHPINI